MFLLYRIGIQIYILAINLAAMFHNKAKRAIQGRKLTGKQPNPFPNENYIWFHCASLGEFEQGRPIIERLRKLQPQKKILLTFYSPSGYEIRSDYGCADVVVYLPFDTQNNAIRFLNKYKIGAAVFVKYELWPNFFAQLIHRQIPLYLVSAVFHRNHWSFRWYGRFLKSMLMDVQTIFVQDQHSLKTLEANGFKNAILAGDTRVDRVVQLKSDVRPVNRVERFLEGHKAVVFGSIYPSDMEVMKPVIDTLPDDVKCMVAPHEVNQKMIEMLQSAFKNTTLWTNDVMDFNSKVLIIDNVGNLNQVYQYASVVYIGGGFDKGIHNILEPAVFNIPICFGPKHEKFHEASSLIHEGLAFSAPEHSNIVNFISKSLTLSVKDAFHRNSIHWFQVHSGATDLIYNRLAANI